MFIELRAPLISLNLMKEFWILCYPKLVFEKGISSRQIIFYFLLLLWIFIYRITLLSYEPILLILDIITWLQSLNRLDSNKDSKHKYAWCYLSAKTDFKHFNLHNVLMKTQLCSLGHHILLLFHPYRLSKYNVSESERNLVPSLFSRSLLDVTLLWWRWNGKRKRWESYYVWL